MIHLLALAGVVSISFSAIFVRLADVSPVTATFFRAAYALPVLVVLYTCIRSPDRRSRRERWLAFASGVVLGAELSIWHESIALIGAGLATVLTHVQVAFVAVAGWILYAERPAKRTVVTIAVVLCGVAMTSGLARGGAYGTAPVAGALLGVCAGGLYALFLLLFRASNRSLGPTAGPLLDSTFGTALCALLFAPLDPHFSIVPVWPAHAWLVALALVTQVTGWLLIASALPRLPALDTSVMLVGQPVLTVIWGVLIFAERLSPMQWTGAAIVLAGVAFLTTSARVMTVEAAVEG